MHFMSNIEYVFEKITGENGSFVSYTSKWGKYGNESLWKQPLHHWSATNEDEMQKLKQYYTTQLALKALKIYALDYRFLPLKPPLWISYL